MAHVTSSFATLESDPLETLELFARRAEMEAQRVDEGELHVNLTGTWRDVGIWFGWRVETQVLQVGAPLELRVPKDRESEICRLLTQINGQLWLGHFDLSDGERGIVYRNAVVLPAGQDLDDCQAEVLLRAAHDAFERFYPAFNQIIWGGVNAEEAMLAAITVTVGNA